MSPPPPPPAAPYGSGTNAKRHEIAMPKQDERVSTADPTGPASPSRPALSPNTPIAQGTPANTVSHITPRRPSRSSPEGGSPSKPDPSTPCPAAKAASTPSTGTTDGTYNWARDNSPSNAFAYGLGGVAELDFKAEREAVVAQEAFAREQEERARFRSLGSPGARKPKSP